MRIRRGGTGDPNVFPMPPVRDTMPSERSGGKRPVLAGGSRTAQPSRRGATPGASASDYRGGKGWLAAHPDNKEFWIDQGIGRRVCSLMERILEPDPKPFASDQPLRKDIDSLLETLVRMHRGGSPVGGKSPSYLRCIGASRAITRHDRKYRSEHCVPPG
jgi:hypothetical protein